VFKISELLSKVFHKNHEEDSDTLTIQEVMHLLHERGFGMMMVLFALPNLFPVFLPPLPTITAAILCIFSFQMILRYDVPHLPHFIAKREMKRESLQKLVTKAMPMMKKTDRIIRPRFLFTTTHAAERYVGALMFIFAFVVAIPFPLTNFVPSVAIIMMGIGIMSKDGLAIILGSILGIIWTLVLIFLSSTILAWLGDMAHDWF
jgi:hypothetical protein